MQVIIVLGRSGAVGHGAIHRAVHRLGTSHVPGTLARARLGMTGESIHISAGCGRSAHREANCEDKPRRLIQALEISELISGVGIGENGEELGAGCPIRGTRLMPTHKH
ncbi:hypothetical protein GCM10028812_37060 [Ancylobacter sonchi]